MTLLSKVVRYVRNAPFKHHLRSASVAAHARQWKQASISYALALAMRPHLSWLWVQYGHTLKEQNLIDQAAEAYRTAVTHNPADEETFYHLLDVLHRLGNDKEAQQTLVEVRTLIGSGNGVADPSPFILLNRARAQIGGEGSAVLLDTAIEDVLSRSADGPLWVQYGHSLKDSGRYEAAENAYRRAIAILPYDADAYLHLGHCLKLAGQYPAAIKAYRTSYSLLGAEGENSDARAELAALGAPPGDKAALPEFVALLSVADRLRECFAHRDWPRLIETLSSLSAHEQSSDALCLQAEIMLLIGDNKKAEQILDQLTTGSAPNARAFIILAREREYEGRTNEATVLYIKALTIDLSVGEAFFALVRLKQDQVIFDAVEPHVFVVDGHIADPNHIYIKASGRTPGLSLPTQLASLLRDDFIQRAEELQAAQYNAQARLFHQDAGLLVAASVGLIK